jgi:hypothetical protein
MKKVLWVLVLSVWAFSAMRTDSLYVSGAVKATRLRGAVLATTINASALTTLDTVYAEKGINAAVFRGPIVGNVTGNVTGNLTGSWTGTTTSYPCSLYENSSLKATGTAFQSIAGNVYTFILPELRASLTGGGTVAIHNAFNGNVYLEYANWIVDGQSGGTHQAILFAGLSSFQLVTTNGSFLGAGNGGIYGCSITTVVAP